MKTGDILVFRPDGGRKSKYTRRSLGTDSLFDEKWLQTVLYHNIELLKVTDATYDKINIIPLCTEFSLHDGIRNLFLDILAITETGRLVLIECKLWKNPQARREVLAQVFEYASLLQSLSYSDLTVKLKKYIKSDNADPISYKFKENAMNVDEALLIDRVTMCLTRGDFHIIIAGDGIRGDLVSLVNSRVMSGMTADLTLLELAVYQNLEGEILLSPSVPSEIETVTRTILLSPEGRPAIIEEEEMSEVTEEKPSSSGSRTHNEDVKRQNTVFWKRAIEEIQFEHPDQEPLRRGGNNWCKALLPDPLNWITAWRSKDRMGVFLRVKGEKAEDYYNFFMNNLDAMKSEISPDIFVEGPDYGVDDWGSALFISLRKSNIDTLEPKNIDFQIRWFQEYLNKFVNYMRMILNKLPE